MASRDWTSLPRDLLTYILEKFETFDEYLLFGRVCRGRCLVVKEHQGWKELSGAAAPLLMVPSRDDPMDRRTFYSVADNKFCGIQVKLQYHGRCCGSSHGWLATFGEDMVITLRNLFSGQSICLPPIFSSPPCDAVRVYRKLDHSCWISKVILSKDPNDDSSPESCLVGVLYGRLGWLAFMRLRDEGWTYVDPRLTFLLYDVIFYSGYLYAIEDRGKLIRVDAGISSYVDKEEGEVVIPRCFKEQVFRAYLVESYRGDMLMIRRILECIEPTEDFVYFTKRFDIFRLVTSDEGSRWVEMESLGDEIIFLGDNRSMSIPCSKFPGGEPNRIYFSDDVFEDAHYSMQGPNDIGVYNVETEEV